MRKISQNAANAFILDQNWSQGNTMVLTAQESGGGEFYTNLYLHGNRIARKIMNVDNSVEITNAGWPTNTTKERLNAIPGVHIVQKDFEWYLNGRPWDGELIKV